MQSLSFSMGEESMTKKFKIYILLVLDGFLMIAIFYNLRHNFKFIDAKNDSIEETNTQEETKSQIDTKIVTANVEIERYNIDELRSLVNEQFTGRFHKIGNQAPVEYLNTYLPNNAGSSIDYWVKPDANYKTTAAFLLDDSTIEFGIDDSSYKETILTFLPEVYEIKEKGIYVIENNGIVIIYVKSDSESINSYIDYIFQDNNLDIGVYKMNSAPDSLEYAVIEPKYELLPVSEFYHEHTKSGAVFNGYFYNIDHSNPDVFLKNGPQTTNSNFQSDLNGFNDKKDLSTLIQIFKYVSASKYHNGDGEKFGRTVDEIMETEILTGCTDYGLLFASLTRDKGIPTIFLQTARIDWIYDRVRDMDNGIKGHILIEVYIEGKWRLVDSTAGKYYPDYDYNNFSLNDGYYVFSKSIEVWDSGISDERENTTIMRNLFKNFNEEAYIDPVHDYIDLRNGNLVKAIPFTYGQQTVTKSSDIN